MMMRKSSIQAGTATTSSMMMPTTATGTASFPMVIFIISVLQRSRRVR